MLLTNKYIDLSGDSFSRLRITYIKTTKSGDAINPSSFGAYLKKYRLMGLTESQIMKIVMRNVAERGNYNLLRKVSQNRGTSIETLLKEYDISNIKEPSTEIKGSEEV